MKTEQSDTAPTYYDLLGLARDANSAQIRKAWRKRTDKAGPGTPEFVALNEAAETLLDPHRRSAYDAQHPEPGELEGSAVAADEATGADATPVAGETAGRVQRLAALVLLPVLALAALGAAIALTLQHRHDGEVDAARGEAVAAATRSMPVVLGYDYRRLAADRAAAERLLTPAYAKTYGKTFDLLEKGADGAAGSAAQTKTVVTATVVGTAVMDAEPDRVSVLAYVNQASKHGADDPVLFQNRIRVSMVERGGVWLIDGLDPR